MNPFGAPLVAAVVSAALGAGPSGPLPRVEPAAVHLSGARLGLIDEAVAAAIARKETPGAVVLVGRHGKIAFLKAYGQRAVQPTPEPMTVDTVFDLASLTKVVATATAVMTLVEDGRVRLSDPVVKLLPEFAAGGGARDQVTVEQLLTHRAGLVADDPMDLYQGSPSEIFSRKHRQPLVHAPGSRFLYSDAGYEVLGELVRAVTGESLDRFAARKVFAPLGMTETGFRPLGLDGRGEGKVPETRVAPTETKNGRYLRGEVHDPRAHALGGVAGHAGLFSTASDLARYCAALLSGGRPVLSPAGVAAMTRPRGYGDRDLRGLGWDIATHYSSSRGDLFPPGSFGHTGWTGTSLWLDPVSDTFVILLSNRNHPDGSGNVIPLRGRVASIVASSVTDLSPERLRTPEESIPLLTSEMGPVTRSAVPGGLPAAVSALSFDVRPGVEVLESQGFAPISGKRVALLTNQTGRTRDGRSTARVLLSPAAGKAGVTLVRLFSPEHGLAGQLDEKVPDRVDEETGLPIRSLYGETRRPARADLEGLDAVVVDLQDAGCRFYTYLTTLGYVLEEAAFAKVAVVVLDRPNPIGGERVEGPPADPSQLSFTAYHPIPLRTGMTIGELARLFNQERQIGAALTVVPMQGYSRELWYDDTGLPWVNPSPNLRSVTQAALYPGIGLLETTNLSVGRGTDSPFEVIGAPWLDARRLASTLNLRRIPGVRFTPLEFRPTSSVFAGELCQGLRITLLDRQALRPVLLGLEVATALRDLHPDTWRRDAFPKLLASQAAVTRFERGESAAQIAGGWAATLMEFERTRAAYLLYPSSR